MPKVNKKRLSAGASLCLNEFLLNFQDLFYQMQLRSSIFGMDWNRFAKKVNFHSDNRRRDKRRIWYRLMHLSTH